jgi:hypothetical protein
MHSSVVAAVSGGGSPKAAEDGGHYRSTLVPVPL